jgi:hypothetical protein
VNAAQGLFFSAWIVLLIGLRHEPLGIIVLVAFVSAAVLLVIAAWARPEVIPLYFGELIPKRRILLARNITRTLEIGSSGVEFTSPSGKAEPLFLFWNETPLLVEVIRNKLKVSTLLRDSSGNIVAEIIRNYWKVSPPPNTWDRNYTRDALELKAPNGDIILRVRSLSDRVQLQGEWRNRNGECFRMVAAPGTEKRGGFLIVNPDSTAPKIEPIFEYPSHSHFGKLRRLD